VKIALLGSERTFHLAEYIGSLGDAVVCKDDKVSLDWLRENGIEFIVSYGYGYILKGDIIEAYNRRAVNLHISFLPWGRGRSPLFWDLMEGNPIGVTIHYIDEGIDTGDIIVQELVHLGNNLTFRECIARLRYSVEVMFYAYWGLIRTEQCFSHKQAGTGSYHKPEEIEAYKHLLTKG